MRHRVYGKHLGRNKDERDNLFRGLVYSLLSHGTIQTSEAKAKAIKGLVDKIINLAKDEKRERRLQSFLPDQDLRERLIKEIVPRLGTRISGFTSMVKLGTRLGDQTMMVRMSLIGAEELLVPGSQLSDKGKSVVGKTVTDNRKVKKLTSRSKK